MVLKYKWVRTIWVIMEETASLIKADQIRYGYDLNIPVAREWGLYISKGEKNSSNKDSATASCSTSALSTSNGLIR